MTLTRADGFIGVMIDDLITKGAEEPCMFFYQLHKIAIGIDDKPYRSNVHVEIRVPNDSSVRQRGFAVDKIGTDCRRCL